MMTLETMEESCGWIPRAKAVVDAADALCGRMSVALDANLLDMETARDLRALMSVLSDLRGRMDSEVDA